MDATRDGLLAGLAVPPGQCGTCRFALLNRTRRNTVYLRCGRAAVDDRFPRYPQLPMADCPGFRSNVAAER